MNFWTGLILGIIVGWLVEWIIDWMFWRRDAAAAREEALQSQWQESSRLEAEWQARQVDAEDAYQARLAAVEAEWQERLALNEQQWQDQFAAVEADRESMRAELANATAVATLTAAGVAVAAHDSDEPDAEFSPPDEADVALGAAALDAEYRGATAATLAAAGLAVAAHDRDEPDTDLSRGEPDVVLAAAALEAEYRGDEIVADEWPAAEAPAPSESYDETVRLTPDVPVALTSTDDLTRVRGIGPKYAALLAAAGITTFDDLAAADPERLRAIIQPGPMQQINFGSWAAQATAFAALRGRQTGDDLTALEGIGPVYATRLREHGITTFAELAATDEATLATVIAAPAWRRIDYGDWIAQARLAAAGDSSGLAELQGRLFQREGDNLRLIHGLGERSAAALHAGGYGTFAALAAATPDELEAVVRGAGARGGDYTAWIDEAGLRAAGKRVPSARRAKPYVVPCPQDLSAVHGIGTVNEQRLYDAGIGSYWQVAELPPSDLEAILGAGAFGGSDLAAMQAEAMRLAVETNSLGRSWSGAAPDNFEALGGVGEIYERRLYEAGICTFAALAATSPERLAEICQAPPMRTPDYAAWIARAAELSVAGSA